VSSAGFRLLQTEIKAHCKKARVAHGSFFFAGTADGSVSAVVSSESFKRRPYFKLWKLAVSRDIKFHMTEAGATAALASRLLMRPSIEQPYFDHSPSLASFLVTIFHFQYCKYLPALPLESCHVLVIPACIITRFTESVHRDGVLALSSQNSALPAAKVRLVAPKAE
jgi:hypothetical protein